MDVLLEELKHEGVDVTYLETAMNSGLTVVAINKQDQVIMFGFTGASDQLFPSDLDKGYIYSAEHITDFC